MDDVEPKRLEWIGTSLKDMRALPLPVRRTFGYALYAAQLGERPPDAKPLKGFGGAGVLEVIEDYRGDTYRAVYTVRFEDTVYVLHVFQKKSKSGIATPKADLEIVKSRLRDAQRLQRLEDE
jgi:phage-related protein